MHVLNCDFSNGNYRNGPIIIIRYEDIDTPAEDNSSGIILSDYAIITEESPTSMDLVPRVSDSCIVRYNLCSLAGLCFLYRYQSPIFPNILYLRLNFYLISPLQR